jgi:hypothetical protein
MIISKGSSTPCKKKEENKMNYSKLVNITVKLKILGGQSSTAFTDSGVNKGSYTTGCALSSSADCAVAVLQSRALPSADKIDSRSYELPGKLTMDCLKTKNGLKKVLLRIRAFDTGWMCSICKSRCAASCRRLA